MIVMLECLDLGDGPAQAVVDTQQVEAALLPCLAEPSPDRTGLVIQPLVLPVAATARRSASWPDHVDSLDICLLLACLPHCGSRLTR